jgi:D-serine deaminase-like pyridoxal phosphate-dependent protein
MEEATCRPRLRERRREIERRNGCRDESADTIDAEPTTPPASAIDAVRTYLGHVTAEGTSASAKPRSRH